MLSCVILCSSREWPFWYGLRRRHARGSGNQVLLCSQVLGIGMLQRTAWGGTSTGQEADVAGQRESLGHCCIGISAGKARKGRVKSLGLANLNNVGRRFTGVVPKCLAPALG